MALCDLAGGMWPPCIMGMILFMARQRVSIFYHIQGKNGRKSSFLAWPEMPRSPRRVCSCRGKRRGIMTATPPYGGQSHEIPVISVYSRINLAFSRILPAVPGINRRGVVVIWCGRSSGVVAPPQRNDAVF